MKRAVSFVSVLAVAAAAMSTVAAAEGRDAPGPATSARAAADKPLWREAQDYYSTLVAPRVLPKGDVETLKDGRRVVKETWWDVAQRHHSTGFPAAAKELARREAIADAKGVSPLQHA